MKFTIRVKLFVSIFLIFIFVLSVGAFIGVSSATKIYSQAILDKELVVGRNLALQLDRLLKLGIPLGQIEGFNEQALEIIQKHPEITTAMVVDTNTKIIFASDPSKVGEIISIDTIISGVESEKENTVTYRLGSSSFYTVIVPFYDLNQNHIGAILLDVPSEVVTSKEKELITKIVIAAATSFIVASIVLFIILNFWINRPLNSLLKTMQDIIQTRDLTRKAAIKSSDEIGILAVTFNRMIDELGKSRQEIEQYSGELEQKVKGRTEELNQKLTELERVNKLMVGRELKMTELKKEIAKLRPLALKASGPEGGEKNE